MVVVMFIMTVSTTIPVRLGITAIRNRPNQRRRCSSSQTITPKAAGTMMIQLATIMSDTRLETVVITKNREKLTPMDAATTSPTKAAKNRF